MNKIDSIYLDMDNTIADLYAVDNWLEYLEALDPYPYQAAAPMTDPRYLARLLNKAQREGHEIGIVTWLSKSGTPEYNEEVRRAKRRWLATHLPSVDWDEVHMVRYGTPKWAVVQDQSGILFDDEEKNRRLWRGEAYEPTDILEVLKSLF